MSAEERRDSAPGLVVFRGGGNAVNTPRLGRDDRLLFGRECYGSLGPLPLLLFGA